MPAAEWRFYQLGRQGTQQALPPLLEKTCARGLKAVVREADPERLAMLDEALWTYREESFLPHGLSTGMAGKNAGRQPILLTGEDERPNGAEVLFLLNGLTETAHDWQMACIVFSGADESALQAARAAWGKLKGTGATLAYWQQNDSGAWENKA